MSYIFVYENNPGTLPGWHPVGPYEEPHVYSSLKEMTEYQWEEMLRPGVKVYQLAEVDPGLILVEASIAKLAELGFEEVSSE